MTKFNFQDFLNDLTTQLKSLADDEFSDFESAALKDGTDFAMTMRDDIQQWVEQVAEDQITEDDLQYLIKGKMEVAQLHALMQAGLAQVREEKFRDAVVGVVVGCIFKAAEEMA